MADEAEIERKFWNELGGSPFVMLGLDGVGDGKSQPMTAFFDHGRSPLWFFTSANSALAEHVMDERERHQAIANFTAKGHDLFASLHGVLSVERDSRVIDRFWNRNIAAWYERGREDPNLTVLRLDADHARIWLGASSFAAPIRRLFGQKPQDAYAGKVAEVLL